MSDPMENERLRCASHLFRVRLWVDELGPGHLEYRGKVLHVVSGEARHFRDWEALQAFLMAKVQAAPEEERPL